MGIDNEHDELEQEQPTPPEQEQEAPEAPFEEQLADHLEEALTSKEGADGDDPGDEAGDTPEADDTGTEEKSTGEGGTAEGEGEEPQETATEKDTETDDELTLTEEEKKTFSERSRQRFENLTGRVKETESQLQQTRQQLNDWHDMVRETKSSPEEFANAIEYMRQLHSDDPNDRKAAFDMLEQARTELARQLGIAAPGVDILTDYPDLQERVKNLELDEATAAEIAKARSTEKMQSQQAQQTAQQAEQQQRTRASLQQGTQELNALGDHLKKTDPDYPKKLEIMKKHVIPRIRQLPPDQWAKAFNDQYAILGELGQAVQPQQPPVNTGTRRASATGGGIKAPQNMEEAIEQGLQHMDD